MRTTNHPLEPEELADGDADEQTDEGQVEDQVAGLAQVALLRADRPRAAGLGAKFGGAPALPAQRLPQGVGRDDEDVVHAAASRSASADSTAAR